MNLDYSGKILKWHGCDSAIVGVDININQRFIYDQEKLIQIMQSDFEFNEEDAYDFMSHSMISQLHGDGHPVIINTHIDCIQNFS